jgi:ABC-type multidrug transport system fused ATPase/permease subunit
MEEGRLGKAYDLRLMVRLGTFLKPYWMLMGFSLLFVLIMASLDLLIPYLTKEAIDRYIVGDSREIILKKDGSPKEEEFWNRYGKNLIPKEEKGKFLIPHNVLQSVDRREVTSFQKLGLFTENRYYLFIPQKEEEERLIKKYSASFERSGSYWFISLDRMKDLK